MPSQPSSAREVLIESLGGLSEDQKTRLRGPDGARAADRRVQSLRASWKWVVALVVTMGLFAVVLPTSAYYHYYQSIDSFSVASFFGLIAGACTFAAIQAGWAVYVYMSWRHQLWCYKGIRALNRAPDAEGPVVSRDPA